MDEFLWSGHVAWWSFFDIGGAVISMNSICDLHVVFPCHWFHLSGTGVSFH